MSNQSPEGEDLYVVDEILFHIVQTYELMWDVLENTAFTGYVGMRWKQAPELAMQFKSSHSNRIWQDRI
jgi:hypothetical protein